MRPLRVCLFLIINLAFFAAAGVYGQEKSPPTASGDATSAPGEPNRESNEFLETFDAAWQIINDTYFDPKFHGVDWSAIRDEFRPKAQAARTVAQLREILEAMLQRLGDSHMAIIPGNVAESVPALTDKSDEESADSDRLKPTAPGAPSSAKPHRTSRSHRGGDLGFEFRVLDGQVVVFRVDEGSPADKAGVKPGWILDEVDQKRLSPLIDPVRTELSTIRGQFVAWELVSELVSGRPGSTAALRFLDGQDHPVSLTLERRLEPGDAVKLGALPTLYARLESQSVRAPDGGQVGLIRFNIWMVPVMQGFDHAIDQYRNAEGMVVDLRGNFGGLGGMILGVSGHFFNEHVSLGTLKMRGTDLQFLANPRRVNAAGDRVEPYAGPVAILTDGLSLSAAEIFAGGMQSVHRARVFGERSGGQALPAVWDRLPNGDILYHAFGDFVTATGTRLEGRGVVPDDVVPLRRADLLAGRDPALEAALDWIARSSKTAVANPTISDHHP